MFQRSLSELAVDRQHFDDMYARARLLDSDEYSLEIRLFKFWFVLLVRNYYI